MPVASLTRRVSFAAAHCYRRPEWSDARNLEVFGPSANPHFHGHSYTCDVTVRGPIDYVTGMVVDLGLLDRVLQTEVRARFDHRNITLECRSLLTGGSYQPGRTWPASSSNARSGRSAGREAQQ